MISKPIVIGLIICFTFLQCKTKQDRAEKDIHSTDNVDTINFAPTSIYGTWIYEFPFYSSELTIKENGTFKFHEQGCTGHGYSEGVWSATKHTITFSSNRSLKKEDTFSIDTFKTTIKDHNLKSSLGSNGSSDSLSISTAFGFRDINYNLIFPDTIYRYFDKEKFELLNDTLFRLNKNGLKTDAKFVLVK